MRKQKSQTGRLEKTIKRTNITMASFQDGRMMKIGLYSRSSLTRSRFTIILLLPRRTKRQQTQVLQRAHSSQKALIVQIQRILRQ